MSGSTSIAGAQPVIIVDTNVLSELMRPSAHPAVDRWARSSAALWTTAITIYELRLGLGRLPSGRRQRELSTAFDRVLAAVVGGRIFGFDPPAAAAAAQIAARCQAVGRAMDVQDVWIAGTVAVQGAVLATRNTRHFADADISLVDPWAVTP